MSKLGVLVKGYRRVSVKTLKRDNTTTRRTEFRLNPGVELDALLSKKIAQELVKDNLPLDTIYIKPHAEKAEPIDFEVVLDYATRRAQEIRTSRGLSTAFGPAFGLFWMINTALAAGSIPFMCVVSYIHDRRISKQDTIVNKISKFLQAGKSKHNSLESYVSAPVVIPEAQLMIPTFIPDIIPELTAKLTPTTLLDKIPDALPVDSELTDYVSERASTSMLTGTQIGMSTMMDVGQEQATA